MLYVDIWFLTPSETLNNLKGDIDIYNNNNKNSENDVKIIKK